MKFRPRLLLLIIPAIVFIVSLIIILLRLPSPQPSSTTVPATVSASLSPLSSPDPTVPPQLQSLVDQIIGFKIQDPRLTPPVFDRSISLPSE